MIGQYNIHSNVWMMCAGNKMSDNAVANRLGTAMQSRLIHLEMKLSVDGWLEWAHANNIDHRVIGFINWKKELLHDFDPNHNDHTFPCPRTWEFMSDIIKDWTDIPPYKRPIASGTVGQGAGTAFVGFCDIYSKLPTIEAILHAPGAVTISDEPSIKYALTSIIQKHMNAENADSLMLLVDRLDMEFQVITLQQIITADPSLLVNESISEWVTTNSQKLIRN